MFLAVVECEHSHKNKSNGVTSDLGGQGIGSACPIHYSGNKLIIKTATLQGGSWEGIHLAEISTPAECPAAGVVTSSSPTYQDG
jgi:hypothetical protein